MTTHSRRDLLKSSLTLAGLGLVGFPEWVLPALAQGETIVPFADAPENLPAPRPETRLYDVRKIDGPFTPPASGTYAVDVRCPAAVACEASASQPLTLVPAPLAAAGPDVTACRLDSGKT